MTIVVKFRDGHEEAFEVRGKLEYVIWLIREAPAIAKRGGVQMTVQEG
jgi:hypothetical protein